VRFNGKRAISWKQSEIWSKAYALSDEMKIIDPEWP